MHNLIPHNKTEWFNNLYQRIETRCMTVFGHEPWWVEFWSALAALFWAYVSQLSGEQVYYHPIFMELSIIASARFWQVCAVCLAILQISILVYNDYKLRWLMCFFAAWFWCFLSVAILKSEPHPPSLALYATFALINLFSMIKLAKSHA